MTSIASVYIIHRVQKLYCTKLKELKQKRILAKLKKINEKRRRYHSVSTEGKITLSASDNSVVNSRNTNASLTSSKSVENYEDIKKTTFPDTSQISAKTEVPKNATGNVSENVSVKDDAGLAMIPHNSINISTTIIVNNPGGEDTKAPSNEIVTNKVTGVMKLCGSPVRMNDVVKEEIHKLLQEEESRTTKVESIEKSSKSLTIQSNFEAGLLNLHNQSFTGRCSASPVSGNTLSTSSSSTVFVSPPVSKTVSKTGGVLEESDEDNDVDSVSKELKMLDAIVASKHEEELVAKKSRERMLKAYSVEKSNMATFSGTKKSMIDYATAEMSPMVWHGLIEERRKKWLMNHSLWR